MTRRMGWTIVCLLVACPTIAQAITLGQVDSFQDGTTMGWGIDAPAVNIASGGPAGSGDRYLQVTSSGGTGFGSQLATRCYIYSGGSRWAGNYAAAGVTDIEMDLRNEGATPLDIRIIIWAANYGDFTSTVPFSLPADGAWHHAIFSLRAEDLTWGGAATGKFDEGLKYIDTLIIRHQSGAPLGANSGTPIASQMGIDNIHALPEPASLLLMALGGLTLIRRRAS